MTFGIDKHKDHTMNTSNLHNYYYLTPSKLHTHLTSLI